MTTSTAHYGFVLPVNFGSTNVWGPILNGDFTNIDTYLWAASEGTTIGVNAPSSSAGSITLTNPVNNIQNISFSASGQSLILPVMNATQSMVVGGTITVNNVGTIPFSILAQDGSTILLSSVVANASVELTLLTNSTANGTFKINTNLLAANNLSDVESASTSRTNLGLGASAVENLGSNIVDDGSGNLTIASSANLPGSPTTTTQTAGDASTKVATTAYVDRGTSGASMVLLSTQTASGSSSIQFTSIPASYDQCEVRITNAIPATNGQPLNMQVSENNGSAFISSGYNYVTFGVPITGTPGGAGATSQSSIQIANATTNSTANQGVQGVLTAFGLGSSTLVKGFRFDGQYADSGNSGFPTLYSMSGNYGSDTNVINAIKFFFASGNIASGTFSLYGIRRS